MCAGPGQQLAPFLRKILVDALGMNGFSQTGCNSRRMKKNKAQKSKSISGSKEDEKENILLSKIIKTREEILDLLRVLKTF
jgi:hypothetical protein